MIPAKTQWFNMNSVHEIEKKALPEWFKIKKGILATMVGLFRCRIILNSRNINSCTKSTATISSKSGRISMWMPPRQEGVWREMHARLYAYINFWRNGAWLITFIRSHRTSKWKIKRRDLQVKTISYLWARERIVSIGTNLLFRGLMARMIFNFWRKSLESSEKFVIIVKESQESYGMNIMKLSI